MSCKYCPKISDYNEGFTFMHVQQFWITLVSWWLRPGHHTDWPALSLHLTTPKCHSCMFKRTSFLNTSFSFVNSTHSCSVPSFLLASALRHGHELLQGPRLCSGSELPVSVFVFVLMDTGLLASNMEESAVCLFLFKLAILYNVLFVSLVKIASHLCSLSH